MAKRRAFHLRGRAMVLQGFTMAKNRILGMRRSQAILLIAFLQFILMRVIPWPNLLPIPAKYADASLYITAGRALIGGASPDSINQEHPPLAKYIIGIFAVYFKNPYASSFVFGLLTAIVVFLIASRLTEDMHWGALAVWILAFDQVNISLSIRPMLDIFMIFFAVLGFYLVITATEGMLQYCIAGLSLGLAIACKLNATLFLITVLVVLLYEQRLKEVAGLFISAIIAYVSSYLQLLLDKGLSAVLNAQTWMLGFQVSHHVSGESLSLLMRVLTPFIVHTSTLAPTGYGGCPPNAFGLPFSSIAETVNAPLLLLPFPLLYWLLSRHATSSPQKRRVIRLLIGTIASCMIYEAIFPFTIGVWYFAPLGTLLAIGAPPMLKNLKGSTISSYSIYAYLSLLTIWLIPANAIYMACRVG